MKRLSFFLAAVIFAAAGWVVRQSYAAHAHASAQALASLTDTTQTTTELNDLKGYVTSHSGSSVTVVLTATYNQAVNAAQEAATETPSSALYAQAQAACGGHANSVTQAQCNQNYIQTHSASAPASAIATPRIADYTYHLVAPTLTFDTSSILFALALVALILMLLPNRHPHHSTYL